MLDSARNMVAVDVACNDPDNGNFAGRAEQIQIGSEFIELEARRSPAPRFVILPGRFRLAGASWSWHSSKDWIGNWCWNAYWMKIPTVVDFLCWLHKRNLYDFTCGEGRLFERWRVRDPFDANDREFLDRILGKPSFHR